MTPSWDNLVWPAARIPDGLQRLAELSGLSVNRAEAIPHLPRTTRLSGERLQMWFESVANWLGLEPTAIAATRGKIDQLLRNVSPAVMQIQVTGEAMFLILLGSRGRNVRLLAPDLSVQHYRCRELAETLRVATGTAHSDDTVDRIIEHAGLHGRHAERAVAGLVRELHGAEAFGTYWRIGPGAGAGLIAQARVVGLPRLIAGIVGSHACQSALWITSWWLLGWMSVHGRFDSGLFWAWLILLFLTVPFRMLTEAVGGTLAIRAGLMLKRQLLAGTCRLESQEVRHWGVGQLLGRVIECEAVESMSVTGGFLALTATVELVATALVLGIGAGNRLDLLLLAGTIFVTVAFGLSYYRCRKEWTQTRLEMTNDLVERMIGHRTRLAQQPRQHWNENEDKTLEAYLRLSREMDRAFARLAAVVPRGWLIVGLLGMMPGFLTQADSTVALSVGVGGVVLGYQALRHFIEGIYRLLGATIAWQRIQFLLEAAARRQPEGHLHAAAFTRSESETQHPSRQAEVSLDRPLLTARNLVFRYRTHGRPVLDGVDLSILAGDRLLLEGASGGGKSTLSSILAGSRLAESGLLLLGGLDRDTVGADGWRKRVVIAPQFHENHVFIGPFSFNLLMGRNWPPSENDLEIAEQLCRTLGLGPLLDRMPGGLHQMVGETGWQLSHGEKSRLYIARALLQQAELTILDESFAALDPQTLRLTLTTVLQQAATLMVVAHP